MDFSLRRFLLKLDDPAFGSDEEEREAMMEKLKTLREKRNLKPKEMAKRLQVSVWLYYKIEQGQRKPSYDFMKKVKNEFGCNIDEIFF